MNKLVVDLENCYGIKRLQYTFDFSDHSAYAIYATNGAMKSSLALTFKDVSDRTASRDRMYPSRVCSRRITDENGVDLIVEGVFVIRLTEEAVSHTKKTSTLLVNSELRKEYEDLHIDIDKSKELLLKALKNQAASKKDPEKEISTSFAKDYDGFFAALIGVKEGVLAQEDAPFADMKYDTIFDDVVLKFLGRPDTKTAIDLYIKKYNELLAASTYFKKGTFNYYNANTIAKTLSSHGFFKAKHSVNLNAEEKLEITTSDELAELVAKEKERISKDDELRTKFGEIEKLIQANQTLRDFEAYLADHEEVLSELANLDAFRRKVWMSYFKAQSPLYLELVEKYQNAVKRMKEIEKEASNQRTDWESVIDIFNSRFVVPFKLTAKNKASVVLGRDEILSLAFTFDDGSDQVSVEQDDLMRVLSTGERRAFDILNVIFEVEARRKANQETLFVVDDIADSFDYKNKYAIIQYLNDIAQEPQFRLIILTHNFDFFRTLESRFVHRTKCLMAVRHSDRITLDPAEGIRNIFVKKWKRGFFTEPKMKIACIPFIRNIIEYTRGADDEDYGKLTSLLHWKNDSQAITVSDLDGIYNSTFPEEGTSTGDGNMPVMDLIHREAAACLDCAEGINFENKIVLSIAIRNRAEQYMCDRIDDPDFLATNTPNQTTRLLGKFKELFGVEVDNLKTIQRVLLMTPENIHLNSFMYEPIIDMSDQHLRNLYQDVLALK